MVAGHPQTFQGPFGRCRAKKQRGKGKPPWSRFFGRPLRKRTAAGSGTLVLCSGWIITTIMYVLGSQVSPYRANTHAEAVGSPWAMTRLAHVRSMEGGGMLVKTR